jgi:hypothetical protein
MVSQTPRFNLDKYSQGEDNWSHSDTVDLLDELAVETDVISNRNASGDYDDELFYATDQKLLYRWDSGQSDWLIEGGVGSSGNRLPSLWADTVNSNVTKHATDISEDYTVDSGEGAVFAGPVTGTGSISGNGKISVIQEGHQFTDNVDAQGNDLNNVGSLNTDDATNKVIDGKVQAGHPDFANPNDALSFAHNNSYDLIEIPSGNYATELIPFDSQTIVGHSYDTTIFQGFDDGVNNANNVFIKQIGFNSAGTSINDPLRIRQVDNTAINCAVFGSDRRAVSLDADRVSVCGVRVPNTVPNNEIEVFGSDCSVERCVVNGVIVDSGSNTSVGDANVTY